MKTKNCIHDNVTGLGDSRNPGSFIIGFWNDAWQNTKDAVHYITSGGDKQYVTDRRVFIDKSKVRKTPYYNFYSDAWAMKNAAGFITEFPSVIYDVYVGFQKDASGKEKPGTRVIEFQLKGKKAVMYWNPVFMKIQETKSAFSIDKKKADSIKALTSTVSKVQDELNQINIKLNKAFEFRAKMSAQQVKNFENLALQYSQLITKLSSINGVAVRLTAKDKFQTSLSGLGFTGVELAVAAVVLVALVAHAISKITTDLGFARQIESQAGIINKELDKQMLALEAYKEGKISKPEYDKIISDSQANIATTQTQIETTQANQADAQSKDDLFGGITSLLKWGVFGLVLVKAIDFIPSKKKA